MSDPREWISRIKEVNPPELWEEAAGRASSAGSPDRPPLLEGRTPGQATPRRVFLLPIALLLAVGLMAGLNYAFRSAPGRGPNVENRGSERARLMTVHVELEGLLGHIWTRETHLSQVRAQIDVAQRQIKELVRRMGSDPTEDQQRQLESLRLRIETFKTEVEQPLAQSSLLEARIADARGRRDELLPPTDAGSFPDVAAVTCDGGSGPERTRLSTPVVVMQQDGVHLHVTNRASQEMYLNLRNVGVWTIAAGETLDIVVPSDQAHDVEIACVYDFFYAEGWQGPTHPLWIAEAPS